MHSLSLSPHPLSPPQMLKLKCVHSLSSPPTLSSLAGLAPYLFLRPRLLLRRHPHQPSASNRPPLRRIAPAPSQLHLRDPIALSLLYPLSSLSLSLAHPLFLRPAAATTTTTTTTTELSAICMYHRRPHVSSPPSRIKENQRIGRLEILEIMVVDVGVPADWVKVNVQRMKDCYEVYALVPGLLREEVRVQSDPAGRLVISGQPEQQDNPWGVTPFKKVVSLPTRIDPHQTSAVVTLHGQLFVRVPFEQSDM